MRTYRLLVIAVGALLLTPFSAHAQYWYSQARCQSFYSVPVNTSFYVAPTNTVFPVTPFQVPAYSSYYPGATSYYLTPGGYPGFANSYYLPPMPNYSSYYAAPSYSGPLTYPGWPAR